MLCYTLSAMTYRLHHNTRTSLTLKKSEFITLLFRVETQEEIKKIIKITRKEHPKASHVCFAYRIANAEQSSDDGEPSGTAGLPMLEVLRLKNIENICALVVRYYGGTQLGAAGLARAYRSSVSECLNQAQLTQLKEIVEYTCEFDYAQLDQKLNSLEKFCTIIHKDFSVLVTLILHSDIDIDDKLNELTNGQISILSKNRKLIEI